MKVWFLVALLSVALMVTVYCGNEADKGGDDDDSGDDDVSDVPVPEGCTGNESVDAGKDALIEHDLDQANFQFGCAWAEDKSNSAAAAWYATTMAAMLSENQVLSDLADDAGGSGSTNLWDFTYSFSWLPDLGETEPGALPGGTPQSTEIIDAAVSEVLPVAQSMKTLFGVALKDEDFQDTVPAQVTDASFMHPDDMKDYEVDTADLYLGRFVANALIGALKALKAWNLQFDLANLVNGFDSDCPYDSIQAFLDDYPDFFELLDQSLVAESKQYAQAALEDYRSLLIAIQSETDPQNNDLFTLDSSDVPRALDENQKALDSLNGPVEVTLASVDYEYPHHTFSGLMYAGAFFEDPWGRGTLPPLVADSFFNCYPDVDLSQSENLSMNGVFPDWSADELIQLYRWMMNSWFGFWWWNADDWYDDDTVYDDDTWYDDDTVYDDDTYRGDPT